MSCQSPPFPPGSLCSLSYSCQTAGPVTVPRTDRVPDREASRLRGSGLRSRVRAPAPPRLEGGVCFFAVSSSPPPPSTSLVPRVHPPSSASAIGHLSHRPGPSASYKDTRSHQGPGESQATLPPGDPYLHPACSHWPAREPAPAVRTWLAMGGHSAYAYNVSCCC